MNSTRKKTDITLEIMSEAGAWMARLNGPYRTRRAEQGFQQWLREDPRHAQAFRTIAVDWEGMEELRRFASVTISAPASAAPAQRSTRPGRMRPVLAIAAVLALAVFGGLFFYMQTGRVATGVGEQRIVTLEDGTRVHLNTATRIQVQYDKAHRRIRLQSGEALFEVAPHRDRPFAVTVGDRQVTALGTAFLIRRDGDRVAVTLMEGKVAVTPAMPLPMEQSKMATSVLAPGERLTFEKANASPERDRPPLEKLLAWQQGKLAIDNMRLSDAVDEMNRYSPVALVIEQPQSAQLLISGVFSVGQSVSFARAVAQSYGLEVREEAGAIVLVGLAHPPRKAEDSLSVH